MFGDNNTDFSISPVNFFHISFDCHYVEVGFPKINLQKSDKYLLPDTSALCGETHFAKIGMGWNKEGIEFQALVQKPFEESSFPEVTKGDSLEVFIDTRDVKTSGFNTRFCHHFFFLPEPLEGRQAGEITRFRTEDVHELCAPEDLKVKSQTSSKGYILSTFIPSHCLYGYEPDQFNRLGFTYRLNRYKGYPQHFSVISEEFQIEQQPSLWSSVRLIK